MKRELHACANVKFGLRYQLLYTSPCRAARPTDLKTQTRPWSLSTRDSRIQPLRVTNSGIHKRLLDRFVYLRQQAADPAGNKHVMPLFCVQIEYSIVCALTVNFIAPLRAYWCYYSIYLFLSLSVSTYEGISGSGECSAFEPVVYLYFFIFYS